MNGDMAYFRKGLRVCWRSVSDSLPVTVSMVILVATIYLSIYGLFHGFFWLDRAPLHTPWGVVWLCRVAAMIWVASLSFLWWRHMVRLGKESADAEKNDQ